MGEWTKERHEVFKLEWHGDTPAYEALMEIERLNACLAHARDAANRLYQAAQRVCDDYVRGEDGETPAIRDLRSALDSTEAEACAREDTALLVDRIHTLEGRLKDAHHYARAAEDRADVAEGEAASWERTASVYERQRDREHQRAELASEREQSARRVAVRLATKARHWHARFLGMRDAFEALRAETDDLDKLPDLTDQGEEARAPMLSEAALEADTPRRDLDIARGQSSRAAAAVDLVRAAWRGGTALDMGAALDALDRALAGVPAYVPEGERQSTKEAPHV